MESWIGAMATIRWSPGSIGRATGGSDEHGHGVLDPAAAHRALCPLRGGREHLGARLAHGHVPARQHD
eukprot:1192364-Prorocentrum_minimum.AAC.2